MGVTVSLPEPGPSRTMLDVIEAASRDQSVDVVKLSALLDMQERIVARNAAAAFNHALSRVSAHMPRVKKNGRVDLGGGKGYDFARWEDMDSVVAPLLRQEGFTLAFDCQAKDGGGAIITGTLLHRDGHTRSSSIPLSLDSGAGRNNLQAMGSTLSYGKRYTTEMLLFRSTPPYGRRRMPCPPWPARCSFDPRLRTGGDPRLPWRTPAK